MQTTVAPSVGSKIDLNGSIDQLDLDPSIKESLHKHFGVSSGNNPGKKICSINKLLSKRHTDVTLMIGGLIMAPIIDAALDKATGGRRLRRG